MVKIDRIGLELASGSGIMPVGGDTVARMKRRNKLDGCWVEMSEESEMGQR